MDFRDRVKNFIRSKWGDICRRSHYVMMAIPFIILVASIVLGTASVIRINQVLDGQRFQYSAEYFGSKKMHYRYLSVIGGGSMQDDGSAPRVLSEGLTVEKVGQIHDALKLVEESTVSNKGKKGSTKKEITNLWEDCYSSMANYPAKGIIDKVEQGSIGSCEIMGVSGAYSIVHPFSYESGGFLPGEDGDRYAIVLNTQLAWSLFHSYNVLGALVEINGTQYQVVGVVNEGNDAIAEATGVTNPRAYIAFNQLAHLANNSELAFNSEDVENSVKPEDLAVLSYEVLLTDPINNIAYNDLNKALQETIGYSAETAKIQVINNTGRFGAYRLYKKYFPLKKSVEVFDGVPVPFYERSARLAEQYVLFWAEALIVSGIALIASLCNVYAIFHGRHTKHAIVEEDDEEMELDIRRV